MDALCAEGYKYSWYFRKKLAPRKWIGYILLPLHGPMMSLSEQLPEKIGKSICGMDNLFILPKFAKQALNESGKDVITHGLFRHS